MTQAEKDQARARTVPGLVRRIFNNQRMTTRKMGRALPSYTYEELFDWVTNQQHFISLFTAWEASNYNKDLVPSIDRKDNTCSYTLTNIQLITWRQNLDNQKADNRSGRHLHTKSKAVRQFTLDGALVAEHASVAIAMRTVAGHRTSVSNISNVCNGKWPTAYGFKWSWA